MCAATTRPRPVEADATPVDDFSSCHDGILSRMRAFAALAPLQSAAVRAREIARDTLQLMDHTVLAHHSEEEEVLFCSVLRSAQGGSERDAVQSLVWRLTDEHREIEALWKHLRPDVALIAAGKAAPLRQDQVDVLTTAYRQHAQTEEREFLPLAREILGRNGNHMAALGLSLHMRHAPVPIAYI
jgi:hypothetical protein